MSERKLDVYLRERLMGTLVKTADHRVAFTFKLFQLLIVRIYAARLLMPFDRTFDSFAPLLDQDSRALLSIATHRISIRLPRVGWDHFAHLLGTMMDYFNPPVWGRTAGVSINVRNALISIHPPRVGWDTSSTQ